MCAGEGAWQRRLVIHPDNCTYLSAIGRISVQGEGAWRWLAIHPDNYTDILAITLQYVTLSRELTNRCHAPSPRTHIPPIALLSVISSLNMSVFLAMRLGYSDY